MKTTGEGRLCYEHKILDGQLSVTVRPKSQIGLTTLVLVRRNTGKLS